MYVLKISYFLFGFALVATSIIHAASVRYALKPLGTMTRAELVVIQVENPMGVLVLSPGCNGNGAELVADVEWQRFAKERSLMLIGLSFASEINMVHEEKGYYYASKGSGQLLLDALDRLTGKSLPVLLYGFSGGAHFTARFAEWRPERVMAWCAYSAGWWDTPQETMGPNRTPGFVVCGEEDGRLGASLFYFKQGRAIGRLWLWAGIPKNGHTQDKRVDAFVREYFSAILKMRKDGRLGDGVWIDVEGKTRLENALSFYHPTMIGWLPDQNLFHRWTALMEK